MLKYYPLCQHYAQFLIVPIILIIIPAYLTLAGLNSGSKPAKTIALATFAGSQVGMLWWLYTHGSYV